MLDPNRPPPITEQSNPKGWSAEGEEGVPDTQSIRVKEQELPLEWESLTVAWRPQMGLGIRLDGKFGRMGQTCPSVAGAQQHQVTHSSLSVLSDCFPPSELQILFSDSA